MTILAGIIQDMRQNSTLLFHKPLIYNGIIMPFLLDFCLFLVYIISILTRKRKVIL